MAISDTKLRKLLDKNQTPCVLSHRDSLSVRVSAKGTITWQYRCGVSGKQVIISLGRYLGLTIKPVQHSFPSHMGKEIVTKNSWYTEFNKD